MGMWTVESVTGTTSDFSTGELFGTNVVVTLRLRYRPSTFGTFTEMPKLDWHEKFIMKEHHKGEWWQFEANMYEHNPCSNTLKIWPGRYVYAYKDAMGTPDATTKGSVKLLSANGGPLKKGDLPSGLADGAKQAEAVRSYLKKNGGILEIKIHDIPSINRPDASSHKERLLKFDCGVVGGSARFRGEQYLDLDGSKPMSGWTRSFLASHPGFATDGLTQVSPPSMVSMKRPATFLAGECW